MERESWHDRLESLVLRSSTGVPESENEVVRANSTMSHHTAESTLSMHTKNDGIALPDRLVDFFCVLGTKQLLEPSQLKQDLSSKMDPTELSLQSHLVDCYPKRRPDLDFPDHLPTFCFPNGCHVVHEPTPPTLLTLVLTTSSGHRLYGAALTFYDTTISTCQLHDLLVTSGYNGDFPTWALKESHAKKKQKKERSSTEPVYHLPKCLVVLSHYAFFDVFRTFLQQLYRIYASGISPLPLERYIANFVDDIPLPPVGRTKVQWECFTRGTLVEILRPPPNQLPLVNFSYKPLFSTLSVANVLVVWGILLTEGRVALCSKHLSLLTPVAEALLSLMFPFEWHGIYIPVLPSSMKDVLDAPVPFLVGLDSTYLQDHKEDRPDHVVFVDLDQDIVHLGWDDNSGREWKPNRMPDLPDRATMELKVRLEELVDHLYLVPMCGIKGRMTTGDDALMENATREPYAQMTRLHNGMNRTDKNHRIFILSNAERAFVDKENCPSLSPRDFILSEQEELTRQQSDKSPAAAAAPRRNSSIVVSLQRRTRTIQAHTDRLLAFAGQQYATPNPFNAGDSDRALTKKRFRLATQFYELDKGGDGENDTFSADDVREAFLSFFISLFARYAKFTKRSDAGETTFRREAFVNDLSLSYRNRLYISKLVHTQMFERFVHDRSKQKTFFDEKIVIKLNGDTLFANSKQPTPFLDDSRWKVRKVIKPPAPYTGGIWGENTFSYKEFPPLDEEELLAKSSYIPASSTLCAGGVMCSAWLCWPRA